MARCKGRYLLAALTLSAAVGPAAAGVLARKTANIFEYLPKNEHFPACLKTVSAVLRRSSGDPVAASVVEPVCEKVVSAAPRGPGSRTTGVMADCAELSGRIEIANKNGYLKDGMDFCSNIVSETAHDTHTPLVEFMPNGKTSRQKFCRVFAKSPESDEVGSDTIGNLCSKGSLWNSAKTASSRSADDKAVPSTAAAAPPPAPAATDAAAIPSEISQVSAVNLRGQPVAVANSTADGLTADFIKHNFGKILRFGAEN